jgi:hypothetical protein
MTSREKSAKYSVVMEAIDVFLGKDAAIIACDVQVVSTS